MNNADYFSAWRPRVLVIEPHPFQLFDLQNVFFSMGCYRVLPIMHLEDLDALLLDCQERFDLALCTCGAFEMSDKDLAQRLCTKGKVKNLIMLTRKGEPRQVQDFRCVPLLGFLSKPVLPMALRTLVGQMFNCSDESLSA